jgi:glycosyltransferase involved in cell wall biosynthesis
VTDRPLRIGIDARELTGQPTGVGRYLSGLLQEWLQSPRRSCHLTLFMPSRVVPQTLARWADRLGTDWQIVVERADPNRAGTWWEQTKLPAAAVREGIDVWFSPGYSTPLRMRCPSVVAIHDMSFFAHPEWFGWKEGMRRRWMARAAARRARRVITISEFSAGEIVRWLNVPTDRIRLAPPGAGPRMSASTTNRRQPVVLFVGSLFNRRRIPEMLNGFAAATTHVPDARLILVGDNRTRPYIDPLALARELGVGDRVEWRAYVTDDELNQLYDRARAFLFLSEYEGFAMTPLEALAHGVPPILLDTPVAREVYGSDATLVNGSPADALLWLLTDDAAHADAVSRGQRLLTRYSWAHAAVVVMTALEEAARGR